MAVPLDLDALLDSDVDGLLDMPEKATKVTAADRLEHAFLEVVEFRRAHGRIPSSSTHEIAERKLGARLDGILANEEKMAALQPLDEFGLLEPAVVPGSIDDVLAGDDFDLLSDESGLLDLSDLPMRKAPESPDSVAKRKKCTDFDQFEHLFKVKHAELAAGSNLGPIQRTAHSAGGQVFRARGRDVVRCRGR